MTEAPFVNREDDLAEVRQILDAPRERPLILFVAAPSGIGKSRFLEEVAKSYQDLDLVRANVRQSRGSRLENGYFLVQIATALHEAAEDIDGIPSLIDFNKNLKNYVKTDAFGLDATDELLKELDVPLVRQIKGFLERRFSLGTFKPRELLGVNEQAAVAYLKRYVRAVLETQTLGLILENAHLIDEDTLGFLVETIEWRKPSAIICEINNIDTQSTSTFWTFAELAEEFERAGFHLKTKLLAPLEYSHFEEVAKNKGVMRDQGLRAAYDREEGNIRAIYNVAAVKQRQSSTPLLDDGITGEALLSALSKDEKFLLVAINVHDGPVPRVLLDKFLKGASAHGLEPDALTLAKASIMLSELITADDGTIALDHDSLARTLDVSAPPAMVHIARHLWIDVYGTSASTNRQWLFYLRLVADHGDEVLLSRALERVDTLARNLHYRDQLIAVLDDTIDIFETLAAQQKSDLGVNGLRRIAKTLFHLEEFSRVADLLPKLDLASEDEHLLRATIADRLDDMTEALALTDPESVSGLVDQTGFAVVRMASLASSHRRPEASALFEQTISSSGTTRSPYYPYMLRNADIFLSHEESLSPIRQSADLFRTAGNTVEQAHAHNTLGMQLGRLGRISEAKEQVQLAEEIMPPQSTDHALVLNNRAVLRGMNDELDATTKMYLSLARDTVKYDFDRIVLALNIATFAAQSDDGSASALFEASGDLLNQLALSNLGLWRCQLWNQASWAQRTGDAKTAKKMMSAAQDLEMNHTPLWRFRLFDEPLPDADSTYLSQQPFHWCFLSKWHFPIDFLTTDG